MRPTSLRRARRPLAGLVAALLALVAGCGGEPGRTETPARGEAAGAGPLARWRRASEPGVWGRPVVIEALRDCRVRLAFRLRDGGKEDRLENRRDVALGAGDSMRIACKADRSIPAYLPAPPEADRAAGRSHLTTHLIHTQIDDEPAMVRSDPVWTTETSPWVGIEKTEPPPGSLDFPAGEVALIAVGVADGAGPSPAGAAIRLDLAVSPPRLVGGPPPPPGGARYLTAFVVSVLPPGD
jgi:hypothetical protein